MTRGAALGARVAVVVLLFFLWVGGTHLFGRAVLPSPVDLGVTVADGLRRGWLVRATVVTISEVLPAFALAALTGTLWGIALGLSPFWGEVFEPLILGVYAIPKITLYPIFLLLFKVGTASKVAFGFFHGIFPVQILTQNATAHMSPVYLKVARSLRLSPWQIAVHIVLPAVLPAVAAGVRLAFSLTFIGVVLGEMSASRAGLGFLLNAADAMFDSNRVLAVIFVLGVIGFGVHYAFYLVERALSPARPEVRQTIAL